MNTALLEFPQSATFTPLLQSTEATSGSLPGVYIGTLPGFRELPDIDLYNLIVSVGEHPIGSTVSHRTLERFGYRLPEITRRGPHLQARC